MANRDSDDDKKGRKRDFNISDDAFESDDDGEFMSDHEFEAIFNPSQKKKLGPPRSSIPTVVPQDLSSSQAKPPKVLSVAPEPEPVEAPKPSKPVLQPCLGCRQPFLRIKRPISLNGPKFPYENENDYCGPCRLAIFAELQDREDCNSSQPVFHNPVVTHIEAKSTSSTTVVVSSTSAAVPAAIGLAPQIRPRTETDFGNRLRAGMASRNAALQQSEITAQTEEAMTRYRSRTQDGNSAPNPQASVEVPKGGGSLARPQSVQGRPIAISKGLQASVAQAKGKAQPQVQKKKQMEPSPPSSDVDPPIASFIAPRDKMRLKQGPIPKKDRQKAELEELLADQSRKQEADKVMLWRKLQTEVAKTAGFATE